MSNIENICDSFDLFLIDQFGVLHNGATPFEKALETLEKLSHTAVEVILISNSGKRSAYNEDRLVKMGFSADHWSSIVTSGEITWNYLKNSAVSGQSQNVYVISNDHNFSLIEDTGLSLTNDPNNADLLLISGSKAPEWKMVDYKRLLEQFMSREVPAICSNPDLKLITAEKNLSSANNFGPGAIAKAYENMGGAVKYFGKPHIEIYDHIIKELKITGRILCIGDSLEHDILGAKNIGAQSLFIKSGIYANDAEISQKMSELDLAPEYISEELRWA